VRRLISRDRKEFLNNSTDILDKYEDEFGAVNASLEAAAAATGAEPANPFASAAPAAGANPFSAGASSAGSASGAFKAAAGAPAAASPFGSRPLAPTSSSSGAPVSGGAYKSSIEPRGLSPSMGPDAPTGKEPAFSFLPPINGTLIFFVVSFGLIIGLMLATFNVVLHAGGVRIAGLD